MKSADQTVWIDRLVCAFVVSNQVSRKEYVLRNHHFYFSTKTYVVGDPFEHTKHMYKLVDKKIITILRISGPVHNTTKTGFLMIWRSLFHSVLYKSLNITEWFIV